MEKHKAISRREFLKGLGVSAGALGLVNLTSGCNEKKQGVINLVHGNDVDLFPQYDGEKYLKKDFSHLIKNSKLGLSPEIIENHLGLYSKYVDKVNKAEKMMRKNEVDTFSLKNHAFSLNGMSLHDIYFSNMSTEQSAPSKALNDAIDANFGSYQNYYDNLVDIAMNVEGWSITGLNLLNGKIFNYGEDTHSSNFPIYVMPIMVLDVYEHAYVMDFGMGSDSKRSYIDVFSKIINWDLVSRRYDALTMLYS